MLAAMRRASSRSAGPNRLLRRLGEPRQLAAGGDHKKKTANITASITMSEVSAETIRTRTAYAIMSATQITPPIPRTNILCCHCFSLPEAMVPDGYPAMTQTRAKRLNVSLRSPGTRK